MFNNKSFMNTYRLIFVNIFIVSAIITASMFGYVYPFFKNDVSHLTYLLSVIIGINVILAIKDSYDDDNLGSRYPSEIKRWLTWISGNISYIGLCGTLIGFSFLLSGLNSSSDIPSAIEHLKTGGLTLANSTLFGIIGWIWLNLNSYLVGGE